MGSPELLANPTAGATLAGTIDQAAKMVSELHQILDRIEGGQDAADRPKPPYEDTLGGRMLALNERLMDALPRADRIANLLGGRVAF